MRSPADERIRAVLTQLGATDELTAYMLVGDQFADVIAMLLQRYAPAAVADWFRAPNVHPLDGGGTPLELARRGEWVVLRAYAEEAVSDGYG